jgi:hypothetical protein
MDFGGQHDGSDPVNRKVNPVMTIIIKSLLLTVSCAILGVAVHHVATDGTTNNLPETASRLPEPGNAAATSQSRSASDTTVENTPDQFHQMNEHLQAARAAAEAMPGYTALLELQEEVDGDLRPVDRIEFKTLREPFSIYMRWTDNEQEALYVDGQNDNRLIVKPTKGLAAIRRVWRLDPDSRMAKQTCRYPITEAGIENLVIRIQEFYDEQKDIASLADCTMEQSKFSDQDVVIFDIKFKDEATVPKYSASRFCFDTQTKLLIAVDNYGWSDNGKPRLIEHYFYDKIDVQPSLSDEDFTEENPEYHFVAR